MSATITPKAAPSKVLADVRVVATFQSGYSWRTPEQNARAAEDRCKEFNKFIRDHRSQDDIRLNVERIYEELCSVCGTSWETMDLDGLTACAGCGAEVAE